MSPQLSQVPAVLARYGIDPHANAATLIQELDARGWDVSVEERAIDHPGRPRAFRALALRRQAGPSLTIYGSHAHRQSSGSTEEAALCGVLAAVLKQGD